MAVLSSTFTYLAALSLLLTFPHHISGQDSSPLHTYTTALPAPFQCPEKPSPLQASLTCPVDELLRLPSHPDAFRPWTSEPYCIHPAEKPLLGFCIFTNADFLNGRGISLITLPELSHTMANRSQMALTATVAAAAAAEQPYRPEELHPRIKYEIVTKPSRGRGLYVREGQSFRAGEIIMRDYPTLLIAKDALEVFLPEERYRMNWLGLMQLPEAGRGETRDMDSKGKYTDEIDNIVSVNAIRHQFLGFSHLSLFPEVAKMNHNCIANAYYRFNETTLALELFALVDIPAGEELTYNYIDPYQAPSYKDRHRYLGSQWGFECTCDLCSSTPARRTSNRRREAIRNAKQALKEAGSGDAPEIVKQCQRLLKLYEEEGMVAPRAMTAEIAAYASNQIGDSDRAVEFARVAKGYWGVMAGLDSYEVRRLEELIVDPRAHGSFVEKGSGDDDGVGERSNEDDSAEEEEDGEVMDAVMAAMARAKTVAKEQGVSDEEEEKLVEQAVKAVLGKTWTRSGKL